MREAIQIAWARLEDSGGGEVASHGWSPLAGVGRGPLGNGGIDIV